MAENSLTTRSAGETITAPFFNDIKQAVSTEFVGRNSAGVPTAGQSLGSVATPWGTIRANQMILSGDAVDVSQITAPQNRIISGKVRSTSNQPAFITPNGAALSFILDSTPTPFQYDVNGTNVSISADITVTGLTAAPGVNNTALINDVSAAGQSDTRLWGEPEHYKTIVMDTVGSNISALVGKYAAFKLNSEYFLAYVNSATELTQCRRGYFYDSSLNPMNRGVFSNNDTLTLMKLGWIFIENNGTTIDVSYNNPTWSFTAPGSPVTGDYWYDLQNSLWKRYDGATFQIISRTFIGNVINSTTACVGARCVDFFAQYTDQNTMELEKVSTEIVKGAKQNQKVRVCGKTFDFGNSVPSWNITTDLATSSEMYNGTEQASTMYYLYVTDTGDTQISDISPYHRSDMFGAYHPHNPWRCVGLAYNDSGADISNASGVSRSDATNVNIYGDNTNGYGTTYTSVLSFRITDVNRGAHVVYHDSLTLGTSFEVFWPCTVSARHHGRRTGGNPVVAWAVNIDLGLYGAGATGRLAVGIVDWIDAVASQWGSSAIGYRAKIGDIISPMTTSTQLPDVFSADDHACWLTANPA